MVLLSLLAEALDARCRHCCKLHSDIEGRRWDYFALVVAVAAKLVLEVVASVAAAVFAEVELISA